MKPYPSAKALANLWLAEFVTPDHHCGLCGNHGTLFTSVRTPAGHWTGLIHAYCICPNGRALKKQTGAKS